MTYDPRLEASKDIFFATWGDTPPNNLEAGMRWNEVVNGVLIEKWEFSGTDWVSDLKTLNYASPRANGHEVRLAISSAQRIFLKESRVLICGFTAQTTNMSVEVSHFYFDTTGNTTTSREITAKGFASGLPNNGSINIVRPINLSVIPQSRDFLQISTRSIGTSTNHSMSAQIDYYLIRR